MPKADNSVNVTFKKQKETFKYNTYSTDACIFSGVNKEKSLFCHIRYADYMKRASE